MNNTTCDFDEAVRLMDELESHLAMATLTDLSGVAPEHSAMVMQSLFLRAKQAKEHLAKLAPKAA